MVLLRTLGNYIDNIWLFKLLLLYNLSTLCLVSLTNFRKKPYKGVKE